MVGLGCHGPDQLVEVVVSGSEDGVVILGSDSEYHSLAIGVEKLQLAQHRGDLGGEDDLVDGTGEGQPLAAQIEGRFFPVGDYAPSSPQTLHCHRIGVPGSVRSTII